PGAGGPDEREQCPSAEGERQGESLQPVQEPAAKRLRREPPGVFVSVASPESERQLERPRQREHEQRKAEGVCPPGPAARARVQALAKRAEGEQREQRELESGRDRGGQVERPVVAVPPLDLLPLEKLVCDDHLDERNRLLL